MEFFFKKKKDEVKLKKSTIYPQRNTAKMFAAIHIPCAHENVQGQ
jgi:hypothetical protein